VSRRAELEAVYRAAWYEVKTPDKNVRRFRVGERVPELDTLAAEKVGLGLAPSILAPSY